MWLSAGPLTPGYKTHSTGSPDSPGSHSQATKREKNHVTSLYTYILNSATFLLDAEFEKNILQILHFTLHFSFPSLITLRSPEQQLVTYSLTSSTSYSHLWVRASLLLFDDPLSMVPFLLCLILINVSSPVPFPNH